LGCFSRWSFLGPGDEPAISPVHAHQGFVARNRADLTYAPVPFDAATATRSPAAVGGPSNATLDDELAGRQKVAKALREQGYRTAIRMVQQMEPQPAPLKLPDGFCRDDWSTALIAIPIMRTGSSSVKPARLNPNRTRRLPKKIPDNLCRCPPAWKPCVIGLSLRWIQTDSKSRAVPFLGFNKIKPRVR